MKGVKVRFFVKRSDNERYIFFFDEKYQYNVTIPVALAAYATQIPTVQENIEHEYMFTRDMLLQDGRDENSLADLNELLKQIPNDIEVSTDRETYFTILFAIRDDFDHKRIDRFVGIEGISVHTKFEDVDENGFPSDMGWGTYKKTSPPDEVYDGVEIDLPRYYTPLLGDLQGIAEI